ncbi:hypothetical protein FQZ97_1104480 [compost metagenome]
MPGIGALCRTADQDVRPVDQLVRRGRLCDVVRHAQRPQAVRCGFVCEVDEEQQRRVHRRVRRRDSKGMVRDDDAGHVPFQEAGQDFVARGRGDLEPRGCQDPGRGGPAPAVRIRHDGRAWYE